MVNRDEMELELSRMGDLHEALQWCTTLANEVSTAIDRLETELSFKKERLKDLTAVYLPTILQRMNMPKADIRLEDGRVFRVVMKSEINASQTKEDGTKYDPEAIAQWLEARGMGGAVKAKWYTGEKTAEALMQEGYHLDRDISINSNTLKSILKDHFIATGELPPEDILKTSVFNHAAFVEVPQE